MWVCTHAPARAGSLPGRTVAVWPVTMRGMAAAPSVPRWRELRAGMTRKQAQREAMSAQI